MSTSAKNGLIFFTILLCILIAALYPNPTVLSIMLFIGSALIIYQFYMVLTDDYVHDGDSQGPAPGYRK